MKSKRNTGWMAALLCVLMLVCVSCGYPNAGTPSQTPEAEVSVRPEAEVSAQPEAEVSALPENGAKTIVSQVLNVYSSAEEVAEVTFAHYEDTPDILLMDSETACAFIFESLLCEYADYVIEETDDTLKITRDNGAYCVLDFVEDSIYFNNFDLFRAKYFDDMSDLLMSEYIDSDGNEIYFRREGGTEVAGDPVLLDLAARNIPLDIYEGKKYIPFQTLNDLFIAPFEVSYLFNSEDLFKVFSDGTIDPSLQEQYYSIDPAQRSRELVEFTVNELCLAMDLYYGLQDEHAVRGGFKTYLERAGLMDGLRSSDPTEANTTLATLLVGYLADLHSDLLMTSPYTGNPVRDYNRISYNASLWHYWDTLDRIYIARDQAMPEGVPAYQEVGNTAYVTFDAFTLSTDRFHEYREDAKEIDDTIGLIMYAHSRITREDSPIENVVLDLSCNTGGYVDSAVYVTAWMLGYCDVNLINPITNCRSTTSYTVDVNLDGLFDENDSIADRNLYCLTSAVSFSASNSVAARLKQSGMVTLLGEATSGGGCAVQFMTTADGSVFCMSTSFCEAVVSNGSYYSTDRGVEPHIALRSFDSYFDREALTEYINNLK